MIITFDEKKHEYTAPTGQVIPSVTQILGKVYGTGLENAPSYFVERAAEKGTAIHKSIEAYLKDGTQSYLLEFETWLKWFSFSCEALGNYECEKIIFATTPYGSFAGTLDLLANSIVYDWKTCKTATRQQRDKWQKQLSFYIYALKQAGYKVSDTAEVVHLTDKVEEIKLNYLGDDFVEETMKLYAEGKQPEAQELQTISSKEIQTLEDVLLQMKALELVIDEYRQKALEEMARRGILNIQIGKVKMTYVPGTIRQTFDSKAFKADEPELYEQYIKNTEVKPSLRITVK